MPNSAVVPVDPRDPVLLTMADAVHELVVTTGYSPPLDDATVVALTYTLAAFFTSAGIPVDAAKAAEHFAARDDRDRRLEEWGRAASGRGTFEPGE